VVLTEPGFVEIQFVKEFHKVEVPADRQMRILTRFVHGRQENADTAVHGIPP
jgi:hypothetical protein